MNDLIAGLAENLRRAFGEEYEVYTESVQMGAKKPCFFIECEKAEKKELLNGRYMIRATVAVALEDERECRKKNAAEAAAKMFEAMEYVVSGGRRVRGMRLNLRFEDKRPVMRGIYDMWLCNTAEEDAEMMETISMTTGGKG